MEEKDEYEQTWMSNISFTVDNKTANNLIEHSRKIRQWNAVRLYMCTYFINIGVLQCNGILKSIRDIDFGYL